MSVSRRRITTRFFFSLFIHYLLNTFNELTLCLINFTFCNIQMHIVNNPPRQTPAEPPLQLFLLCQLMLQLRIARDLLLVLLDLQF